MSARDWRPYAASLLRQAREAATPRRGRVFACQPFQQDAGFFGKGGAKFARVCAPPEFLLD